jgi:hypothetical protein
VSVACGAMCATSLDVVKGSVVQVEVEVLECQAFHPEGRGAVILER